MKILCFVSLVLSLSVIVLASSEMSRDFGDLLQRKDIELTDQVKFNLWEKDDT